VRKLLVGLLLGLAAAIAAALLGRLPFVQTVEMKTYDWRMRLTVDPASARRDVALVAIDEVSIRSLEPAVGRWPWPRLVHAGLIDFLARAPAKVIVYDVIFTERDRKSFKVGDEEWTGEESDRALAEATARAGNVVHVLEVAGDVAAAPGAAAGSALQTGYRLGQGIEERPNALLPYDELAKASRALGHDLMVADPDGPVRRTAPFVRTAGQFVPSLAVAAAMLATGTPPSAVAADSKALHLGPRAIPLLDQDLPSFYGEQRHARRALVRYPGGVLNDGKPTYAEYSFVDLFYSEIQLKAGEKPLVDPARFRGAVVFVGTTATALFDQKAVPLPGKMAGMQIHASAFDNIIASRFLAPAPAWAALALLGACTILAGVALVRLGVWPGLASAAVLAALSAASGVLLFGRGVWLPMVTPLVGLTLSSFGGVSYQYFVEGREKRRVKRLFSRYVSKDVFDQLMSDPSKARLGGERREMTVLFSDIRGFTTFSEQGQPEAIVEQLNEYFSRMVHVIFEHRGTLDKFVGDAVMALFGAPLDDPDHAEHAVRAGLAMLVELEALNRRWAAEGRPTLAIGVGVNTGDMVAGNIGSDTIMSYTVIGDAVNLASRLESLNKQHGTSIIVSDATRRRLAGEYDLRPLGEVVVKGKTQAVAIFEVRGGPAAGSAGGPVPSAGTGIKET
jgi:adenylate cyclase